MSSRAENPASRTGWSRQCVVSRDKGLAGSQAGGLESPWAHLKLRWGHSTPGVGTERGIKKMESEFQQFRDDSLGHERSAFS